MNIPIEPINKIDVPDTVAKELRELIVSGYLPPGGILPSYKELSNSFNVGYTTVREAIKKLETLGLVQVKQGTGIFVRKDAVERESLIAPFDLSEDEDLLDLMEVRKIIETGSINLAVKNITEQQLQRLETLLTKMKENINNYELFISHDISFHIAVAEASGNSILLRIIRGIAGLIYNEQKIVAQPLEVRKIGYTHHKQIYEALKNPDIGKGAKAMQSHLEEMENRLTVAIQNRTRGLAGPEFQK